MEEDNQVEEVEQQEAMTEEEVVEDAPNTRFERSPRTQAPRKVFKQPAKNYYKLLMLLTAVKEGTKKSAKLVIDTPGSIAEQIGDVVDNLKETSEKAPSIRESYEMLKNRPDMNEFIEEEMKKKEDK